MKKLILILYAASFTLTGLQVANEWQLDPETTQKYPSAREIAQHIGVGSVLKNLYGTRSFAFSNDGKKLVVESLDRTLRIVDLATARQEQILKYSGSSIPGGSKIFKFSPDDKKIASTQAFKNQTKIILWDVASGKQDKIFAGHYDPINSLEFSPDGKKIITTATLDPVAILWDVNSGKQEHILSRGAQAVVSAKFSPDGQKVVTSTLHDIKLWDVGTGLFERGFEWDRPNISFAEFSPDGRKIAVLTATTLGLLDLNTNETSYLIENLPLSSHMQFSKDGKIAVYSRSLLKVFDVATGQLGLAVNPVSSKIYAAQFVPNSKEIEVLEDTTVKRFDAGKTADPLRKMALVLDSVEGAKFSPDRTKLVTTFSNDEIHGGIIWNLNYQLIKAYFMNKLPGWEQEPIPLKHQALLVALDKISKEKQGGAIELKDLGGFQNILVNMPTEIALALREYYHIADEVFVRKSASKKTDVPVYTKADFLRERKGIEERGIEKTEVPKGFVVTRADLLKKRNR